jgi:hypothetical protein
MPVWRGNVDAPVLERHSIFGNNGWERSATVQDFAQEPKGVGRPVLNDQNRGGQIRWELAHECREGLHAAHRCADDNDVTCVHVAHHLPLQPQLAGAICRRQPLPELCLEERHEARRREGSLERSTRCSAIFERDLARTLRAG